MQQKITSLKKSFNTTLTVPGSKSISNRAMLLAALANGQSTLSGLLASDDTLVFAKALRALGIAIDWDQQTHRCTILGNNGNFPAPQATVWCQDAGTATRFLLAACANASGHFHFDGSTRMRERPLAPLIEILKQQGTTFQPENATNMPLQLMGANGLQGGEIFISSQLSSQFLSGLLMVAPFAKKACTIKTETHARAPYVAMTCHMMQQFGVAVLNSTPGVYHIAIPQAYQACGYSIEPDLSTASYFFAAAALTQSQITIANLDRNRSLQGDIAFLSVLENMGAKVINDKAGITLIGPKKLRGISVDMNNFSDTFMTLAAIAPFADSPVTIKNIAHTRLQESDRIAAVASNLALLGITTKTGDDSITIYPGIPQAATLSSVNDHRIAMAFALIGLKIQGVIINDAECVAKTCPDYFELLKKLYF